MRSLGCRTAVVDVTDDAAVAAVAGQAPDCRILVNNAAIQRYQDLLHTTHDEMRTVLDVNVIGPVLMAQALVPVMAANGGGVVINLSSITSRAHAAATSLYPASKAAVNQLTQAMAVEFAPLGVRCNAVGPGTVITEGTAGHYGDEGARAAIAGVLPANRMGQPEDIANAVSSCAPTRPPGSPVRPSSSTVATPQPTGSSSAGHERHPSDPAVPLRDPGIQLDLPIPVGRPRPQGGGQRVLDPLRRRPPARPRGAASRARDIVCRRSLSSRR